MFVLSELKQAGHIDWGITSVGHNFAGMIVSFLVVSRINTALGRYALCRSNIGKMYRESRELTQTMLVISRQMKNTDRQAKEWRNEMAYRTLCLLRTSVAVVLYNSRKIPAWEVPELTGPELEYVTPKVDWRRHAQSNVSVRSDSMRVPLRVAYLLRESICSQGDRLKHPMPVPKELKLMGSVDSFLNGYYGMREFMTTPVPFPLIQMTRTIVLLYIFTIPFVLLADASNEMMIPHCATIFMLTYGFMGLELVSIELDDPFGDDDNDFDVLAYARVVFEDTYMLIHDTDGQEWADSLRYRMHENASEPISEKSGLIMSA